MATASAGDQATCISFKGVCVTAISQAVGAFRADSGWIRVARVSNKTSGWCSPSFNVSRLHPFRVIGKLLTRPLAKCFGFVERDVHRGFSVVCGDTRHAS